MKHKNNELLQVKVKNEHLTNEKIWTLLSSENRNKPLLLIVMSTMKGL